MSDERTHNDKLDAFRNDTQDAVLKDHEDRLRKLEESSIALVAQAKVQSRILWAILIALIGNIVAQVVMG